MSKNLEQVIHNPNDAGMLAVKLLESLRADAGGGITTGIPKLDTKLLPLRSGELITVLGYTSNYKSGFMNWLSKQALKTIERENDDAIVLRVTWEQSVEEDTISWLAGATNISISKLARGLIDEGEWKILQAASIERSITPMWIIGHSQMERAEKRRARPRMTMPDVYNAISMIADGEIDNTKHRIRLIVLDYLQRIRPDPADGDSKREQMLEAVNKAKDLALAMSCPVVLGVQAGRQVIDRDDKFPRIDDGQETSNIEQSSDKIFSLWYPSKTEEPGSYVLKSKAAPGGFEVTKNLLLLRVLKQKLGEAPITVPLYVNPETNLIGEMTV